MRIVIDDAAADWLLSLLSFKCQSNLSCGGIKEEGRIFGRDDEPAAADRTERGADSVSEFQLLPRVEIHDVDRRALGENDAVLECPDDFFVFLLGLRRVKFVPFQVPDAHELVTWRSDHVVIVRVRDERDAARETEKTFPRVTAAQIKNAHLPVEDAFIISKHNVPERYCSTLVSGERMANDFIGGVGQFGDQTLLTRVP